ncbi:MAG: dual specificity protein phosphatase family protein [Propionicimonas sp.]
MDDEVNVAAVGVADAVDFAVADAVFVTDRVAVGADLAANFNRAQAQLAELVGSGITHIVDLRSEWSDEALVHTWAPQVKYLHHRVQDAGQIIDPAWFNGLVDWVRDALDSDPAAKVLIHCHMGVNRAPSAVLAVLMDQGITLRDGLNLIRDARPVAVIDYAGSVVNWYCQRHGCDARTKRNLRRGLVRWRQSHHIDGQEVIRQIRSQETPNSRWAVRLGPEDPEILGKVLTESGEVAVNLAIDLPPEELGQLDEVLFLTEAGLNGRGLVVGPAHQADPGGWQLPVMITDLFRAVPVSLPDSVAAWMEDGQNPCPLSIEEYWTIVAAHRSTQ